MNYLITAAGLGKRFLKKGIKPPKPLIRVKGIELLLWSINSFDFHNNDNLYIASLRADKVKDILKRKISLLSLFLFPTPTQNSNTKHNRARNILRPLRERE